ncbi:MAG: 50S ribosomal protein L32 [Planctomycetes bacterium]|nr:50S ribosomal protein L32 [Planctomycetota bacterium]
MAAPKKKTSKARKHARRSHLALSHPTIIECSRCHTPIEPHTVCGNCGHYRGRSVIDVEE